MEFPDRSPLTLNPVSVEKWLARNCMLNVMNLGVYSELNPPPTLMKIQYVKGEPSTIYQRENGDFVNWELNVFQSTQLQNAIQELIGLAVP